MYNQKGFPNKNKHEFSYSQVSAFFRPPLWCLTVSLSRKGKKAVSDVYSTQQINIKALRVFLERFPAIL